MDRTCPACGTPAVTPDATPDGRHCHACGAELPSHGSSAAGGNPTGHPSGLSSEVRNWAMAAHLSAFLGAWVALALLGPLVVWLIKRHDHPFIRAHATEALNFNICVLVYVGIGIVLAFVLIGIPLLIVLGIAWLVLTIVAAVRAANGESYRYPLTIRFVS